MKTKKSRERQHKPVKHRDTYRTKTDKTKYKERPKKNWTKTQASTSIPKHKSKSLIQSEEPLKEDSEEQAVHIIPH